MIKVILFLLFIFSCVIVLGQNSLPLIKGTEIILGENLLTKQEIKGFEYSFPDRIHELCIDSISQLFSVQIRGLSRNRKWLDNTGSFIIYDFSQKKSLWSKHVNYNSFVLSQVNDIIIESDGVKSWRLNNKSGKNRWEIKKAIYYVDPFTEIGLGYDYKSLGNSDDLQGINLVDGTELWKRRIRSDYGWNSIFHLNDSTLLLVAAGLHSINTKDGTGWDYNAVTGQEDYSGTAVANAAGIALGVLTGAFAFTSGHNVVRDLVSNIILDSLSIYFASKEKISCLDHYGKIKWSLPEVSTSKSTIFIKDSSLYMINLGYAFMGYRKLNYGRSFFAKINLKDGQQQFRNYIKEQIAGFQVRNDIMIIIAGDRIVKYSMGNGELLFEKMMDTKKEFGSMEDFISNSVYILSDDSLPKNLATSDSSLYFVFTSSGKTLGLNHNFEIDRVIPYNELFIYYSIANNYKFFGKEDRTIIVNDKNKIIANLRLSSNSRLLGYKLYDSIEEKIMEVDLSALLE